jgi:arsenite-transporting ATPase
MREHDRVAAVMRRDGELAEDEILKELQYIKQRINAASGILTDRERTAFFFVLVPEEMAILDTQKAAALFQRYSVPLCGYVLNRVLPRELLGQDIPQFLRNRIEMQGRCLQRIESEFGSGVLSSVPEMERDITGLDMIAKVAVSLLGERA